MVKFEENGQAYWDFILENCIPELIAEIKKDEKASSRFKILSFQKEQPYTTFIYAETSTSFIVYEEFNSFVHDKNGDALRIFNKNSVYKSDIMHLQKLGVI